VTVLGANVARQQDRVRVFEVGACFVPGTAALAQPVRVGGLIWGRRAPESWLVGDDRVDFFDLKGDVERLLAWVGVRSRIARLEDPVLHPGQSAGVWIDDRPVGRFGRLHPEIERSLGVSGEVFVLEFDVDALLEHPRRGHGSLSRFPSVRRDLALVVRRDTPAAEIVRVLEQTLGEILVDLRLFDVYQGKGIDSTEKSIGVGLTLQKPSATLNEVEIGRYMETAVAALAQSVGARLR
jgi:phenylalanyl-tRNA synthetase beta chain